MGLCPCSCSVWGQNTKTHRDSSSLPRQSQGVNIGEEDFMESPVQGPVSEDRSKAKWTWWPTSDPSFRKIDCLQHFSLRFRTFKWRDWRSGASLLCGTKNKELPCCGPAAKCWRKTQAFQTEIRRKRSGTSLGEFLAKYISLITFDNFTYLTLVNAS